MAWTEPPKDAVTNPGQFSVAYRDEDGEGRLCVPTKETEEAARTLAKDLLIAHVYSPEGTKIG